MTLGLLTSGSFANRFAGDFTSYRLASDFSSHDFTGHFSSHGLARDFPTYLLANDLTGYGAPNRLASDFSSDSLANGFANQRSCYNFLRSRFFSNCHRWYESSFLWSASDQGCCLPYTVLRASMQVFADDGTCIDVSVDGPQRAGAVVMIHGFPMTRSIWNAQIEMLATHSRVLLPDVRGAGTSSVPDGPYLVERLAADVAVLLDSLGIERAALVGHSMGGYVALAFARMFTERITRLALVSSRLRADTPEEAAARYALADRVEREASIEPAIEAYVPKLVASGTPQRDEVIARAAAIARQNTPAGIAATLRGLAVRVSAEDIAEDLDIPVLVVAGGEDRVVSLDEAQSVAGRFP
ncbi:MAG: alpha/beta fold hydrolase, partial [Candidatus Eremiobacteraeota bacterium]|nr:alpha/beta fold hydrolase [Candidatus Eremiobacteraeota bacterium]